MEWLAVQSLPKPSSVNRGSLRSPCPSSFSGFSPNAHIGGSSSPETLALPPEGKLENHQLEVDGQQRVLGQGSDTKIHVLASATYSLRVFTKPRAFDGLSLPICQNGEPCQAGFSVHFCLAI